MFLRNPLAFSCILLVGGTLMSFPVLAILFLECCFPDCEDYAYLIRKGLLWAYCQQMLKKHLPCVLVNLIVLYEHDSHEHDSHCDSKPKDIHQMLEQVYST